MKLLGRRAVVTGSSRSIGRAIAITLAKEGAQVVVNARGMDDAGRRAIDDVVEEIRAFGGIAVGLAGAVDDPGFAQQLIDGCVAAFGGVDILVNNAGACDLQGVSPVTDCSIEAWRKLLAVNLDGVFYTSRAALPYMVAQRWGRIINAGSVSGTGRFGGSSYVASKSALFGLGRAMAADYGPYGITVNTYNPEAHSTADRSYYPAVVQHWLDRGYVEAPEAAFRAAMGGPDGIASWIAYLGTDEAAYLNGQVFAVDSRRISLLGQLDDDRVLFGNFSENEPGSLEALSSAAPLAFPVKNAWPRRSGDDLTRWERPLGQFVPGH